MIIVMDQLLVVVVVVVVVVVFVVGKHNVVCSALRFITDRVDRPWRLSLF
jgi:hypothetical protein